MSVKILSQSAISRKRTLVYQTLYAKFVVLIQQKKIGDVWTVYQHCLIRKLFINTIAALPNKTEPSESSIITSGGFLPPKSTPSFGNYDVDTLTDEVRRIFYRYGFECVPLCENQLRVYRACDELTVMWVLNSAPGSPVNQTPASAPGTPAVDPCHTVTPTPSPSLFAEISKSYQQKFCKGNQDFNLIILSGTRFHTPQQPNSDLFETPESGETPQVCAAPKKRRPENNLMDIFDI